MRIFFLGLFFLLISNAVSGQAFLETLQKTLHDARTDTGKVSGLIGMAAYYSLTRADSTIYFAKRAMDLSEKIHYPWGTFMGHRAIFYIYMALGMYPKALELANQNKRLVDEVRNTTELKVEAIFEIGVANFAMGQYDEAKQLFWDAIEVDKKIGRPTWNSVAPYAQLSALYLKQGKLDSAFLYAQQGNSMLVGISMWSTGWLSLAHCELGNVYFALGNFPMALRYYQDALNESIRYNSPYLSARAYRDYARLFFKSGQPDSCIRYANLALAICLKYNFGDYASDVCKVLVDLYQSKKMPDSALKYLQAMVAAKDTIFSQTRASQFLLIGFDEKQHQQEVEIAQTAYRNKVRILVLGGVLSIFLLLAGILYRNNLQRKKTNKQLEMQKKGLEATLQTLKTTQQQLIQSEKMASLGELTAGIAHEIQNPLNFVNNFSEVNKELLIEMKAGIDKGNLEEVKAIANDVIENQEKINHHGKRAEAIVKGMLQHSKETKGQKEPTDINGLANEYLRLSYQGLRAKDKAFNAKLKTDYDPSIGKINIIPQDIGRVLLNLFNNAFYAVSEKKKQQPGSYEPTVSVSTKKIDGKIEISVKDNGNGIPEKIMGKIFQPFFTTKPAGQGTGLGLSLSYDIIKTHGGEIKVETKEGEFTEFVIQLPVSS